MSYVLDMYDLMMLTSLYEIPTKKAVEVEDISDKPSGLDWIDDIMRMNPDELHKKIGNGI